MGVFRLSEQFLVDRFATQQTSPTITFIDRDWIDVRIWYTKLFAAAARATTMVGESMPFTTKIASLPSSGTLNQMRPKFCWVRRLKRLITIDARTRLKNFLKEGTLVLSENLVGFISGLARLSIPKIVRGRLDDDLVNHRPEDFTVGVPTFTLTNIRCFAARRCTPCPCFNGSLLTPSIDAYLLDLSCDVPIFLFTHRSSSKGAGRRFEVTTQRTTGATRCVPNSQLLYHTVPTMSSTIYNLQTVT